MKKTEIINGGRLLKRLKRMESTLKNWEKGEEFGDNRLFQREIRELIKTAREEFFPVSDGEPLLGSEMANLPKIDDNSVRELIQNISRSRYLGEEELKSLYWQGRFSVMEKALRDRENADRYIEKIYALKDLDYTEIEKLSPLHAAFSRFEDYQISSKDTKAMFRKKAAVIARSAGISEERYMGELVKAAAAENGELERVIDLDYRRVFPYAKATGYISGMIIYTLLFSLALGFFTRLWAVPLVFLPVFGMVKPIMDMITAGRIKGSRLPEIEIEGDLPEDGETACVISALAPDEGAVLEALTRLKTAKLKNPQGRISFALLCDLKGADSEKIPEDRALFKKADKLREEIFPESVIIFRKRSYSKTMRKWQGFDRKRGAVEELLTYLCGSKADFAYVCGDISKLKTCEFVAALDLDTIPLMDSVKKLTAIALHPLNKGYGIIAPRCTSTLSSTLKTPFARAMAGNGGVSGISSYDSFSGEFYFDCFGEGIFCGKGLIRKRAFLAACKDKFPAERVLSHDILEGGLAGTAYSGDCEFSDSFPPSSRAYFKRAHRWIRGDFQNLRYIFRKDFSALTRFKLFDNFRRGISPLLIMIMFFCSCFMRNGVIMGIAAYTAVLLPYILPLASSVKRGFAFGLTRRFYSPIVSESKQLLTRAVMELMTLPKSALISLDAGVKTLWRNLVSKRNLLEWTTSGLFERTASKGGVWHLLPAFFLSLLLLFCCRIGDPVAAVGAIFMCAAFPVLIYCDKPREQFRQGLNQKAREELMSQAEKMWSFYTDYVTEENSYLPPDNVQFSPVYRVCDRTSPTNIGMYLLSAAAVYKLGLISGKQLVETVEKTVETVEKMAKWKGNLLNWYMLKTLEPVSSFVSSVDSGNFLCCLIALRQCIYTDKLSSELTAKIDVIIEETDLSAFYCKGRNLFSIGYDLKEEKLSPHRYDMLMSEARLLSYCAIALGQAPKEHWRALSRTMSRFGKYAGAMAWTGTMFEFYMPELLLTSKEGSMSYEALRYAFYCQRHRHIPFGISESGYYAFDSDMNYQYKAHGVQKNALKGGMNRECVISPYSSYLTMSLQPLESYNNLVRLEKEGAFNPKYGFYEAVDYTDWRVGEKAVVKSHMAHHVGMSIAGVANAIDDNICSKLFMSNEKIKRAEELLEEKVMAGEKVLKIADCHYDKEKTPCEKEEFAVQTDFASPINALHGGGVTLFTSANGSFCGNYKGLLTVRKNSSYEEYLNSPKGAFYALADEKTLYPLFSHPYFNSEIKTVFSCDETVYSLEERDYSLKMTVFADGEHKGEIRKFNIANNTHSKRQVTLCGYSEPVLAREADENAHPMFMDLFLKIHFDKENKLFVFSRKDRHSDKVAACAAGFIEDVDLGYCLSKEECKGYAPFDLFSGANNLEKVNNSVPCPCLLIKCPVNLDLGESKELTLFYCYADSVEEAVEAAKDIRLKGAVKNDEISPSPLPWGTLHGRMGLKALPALLYGEINQEKILLARRLNSLNKRELWQFGISGDYPLLVTKQGENLKSAALAVKGLERCGVKADLIVLCSNGLEQKQAEGQLMGTGYALIEPALSTDLLTLIYALSAKVDLQDFLPYGKAEEKPMVTALPILPCNSDREKSGFNAERGSYVISGERNIFCNILSGPRFGTLLSQNSLGFTWAENSRENKLTPWSNDIVGDNRGEMLLLKSGCLYYDLIRGSRAEFSPQSCLYTSKVLCVDFKTEVKVYRQGMGKEITVTAKNDSDKEQIFQLAYKIIPLLGDRKGLCTAHTNGKGLVIANSQNHDFKGAMCLYCSKKPKWVLDGRAFSKGDFSSAREEFDREYSDMAAAVIPLKLPPRESVGLRFILGYCPDSEKDATEYVKSLEGTPCGFETPNSLKISTPDNSLNELFNTWLPHQIISCRIWARTGFFQNGGAYGFRDQLQDCLGAMYLNPKIAKDHIFLCCGSQFPEGDVLHWWHDLGGKRVGVRTRYSDDLLWLPYVSCVYDEMFKEEGFWQVSAEYCSGGQLEDGKQELFMEAENSGIKESLYLHCKAAMEKGFVKGERGLIKIGCGDWNDGYNNVGVKGRGESVWLSMFYVICGRKFAAAAKEMKDTDYQVKLEKRIAELTVAIEENAWDGSWYLRAFYDSGEKMGSSESNACQIDLLPQAFAALAQLPDAARAVTASNSAWDRLVEEEKGIIKLFTPAFTEENTKESSRPGYVMSYPQGIRENGGQYTHAAVWYCMSCFKLGQWERGFKLLNMLNPAYKGQEFGREPYFITADISANPMCYGRGGWSIYTGAASWYYKCILEGLFGIGIREGKLIAAPNLPPEFTGTEISLDIFGVKIRLEFIYSPNSKPEKTEIPLTEDFSGKIYY